MQLTDGANELARLSRSVARLRWTSAGLVALNLAFVCGAWRGTGEVVEAQRFVVVDELGQPLAQLGKLDGVLVGLHLGTPAGGESARLAIVPSGKGHGGAAMLEIASGDAREDGAHSEVSLASTSVGTHLGFTVERKSGPAAAEKASLSLTASQEEVAIRGKPLGKSEGFKLPE